MRRKLGSFSVNHTLIEDNPEIIVQAFKDVLILRAESNYAYGRIEYIGISELFEEVPLGSGAYEYKIIVRTSENEYGTKNYEFEFKKV